MKSIYKTILTTLMVALTLSSCDTDNLDIEQKGVLTLNTYETANDEEVNQFVAAIYAAVMGDAYVSVMSGASYASHRYLIYYLAAMGAETCNYYDYFDESDGTIFSQVWSYYYRLAYFSNMLLEYLPNNEVASTDVKEQALAEARAIRAIAMMNLVQLYGNPPLADHILDGSEGNTPAAESWAFIESELAEAAESLPSKSGLDDQSTIGGRLTKEAAYAYLGKAQLWQGNYSDAASTLYNKVISTGKYALIDDYDKLNSSSSDFCSEYLWEFDFSDDGSASISQEGYFDVMMFTPFATWYSKYASLLMAWSMGCYAPAEFAEFMAAHDGTDSQRYVVNLMSYADASQMASTVLPISECEGYVRTKGLCWEDDLVGSTYYVYNKANVAYMRYAEVLLNYAEAVCQGGSSGSSLSGLEALNLVRRRAGLSDAPSLDMDNETYGIKAECRAEFYYEGHRWIDLVRWGDAATVLADCGKLDPTLSAYDEETGEYTVLYTNKGGPGFVAGKNELFPIPLSELYANDALEQNPGW